VISNKKEDFNQTNRPKAVELSVQYMFAVLGFVRLERSVKFEALIHNDKNKNLTISILLPTVEQRKMVLLRNSKGSQSSILGRLFGSVQKLSIS
jgi:hypothetical protein